MYVCLPAIVCSGHFIDPTVDPLDCSACGHVCPGGAPDSVASCVAGACVLTCNGGYVNCDGNDANGCEVNTTNNLSNCGACGIVCPARPNR